MVQQAVEKGDAEGGQGTATQLSRRLPDFAFGKHMPDLITRVLTEISGAPFVRQAAAASSNKSKRASQMAQASSTVDVNDLLQPKKKARKVAKAKAKSKATNEADTPMAALDDDVQMQAADAAGDEGGSSRPRWWIDDVLGCLAHAAGGLLDGTQLCCAHNSQIIWRDYGVIVSLSELSAADKRHGATPASCVESCGAAGNEPRA